MKQQEEIVKELLSLNAVLESKENKTEDGWPKGSDEAKAYADAYNNFWNAFRAAPKEVTDTFYLISASPKS